MDCTAALSCFCQLSFEQNLVVIAAKNNVPSGAAALPGAAAPWSRAAILTQERLRELAFLRVINGRNEARPCPCPVLRSPHLIRTLSTAQRQPPAVC